MTTRRELSATAKMLREHVLQPKVAVVTCKCVGCGARRDVEANEIPPDEVPMCSQCGSPMVAESARAK